MRIAICLHGKVGNIVGKADSSSAGESEVLALAAKHYREYMPEADYFIHSWNTNLKEQIIDEFNPKGYIIEQQKEFDIPDYVLGSDERQQGHYSRWYSAKQVSKLKRKFEKRNKPYDAVMLARFDIAWKKTIDFKKLDLKAITVGGWYRTNTAKVKDFFFISNSKGIDRFTELYDNLEYYTKSHNNLSNGKYGVSSHKLAKTHMRYIGAPVKTVLYCGDDLDASASDYPLIRYQYYGATI